MNAPDKTPGKVARFKPVIYGYPAGEDIPAPVKLACGLTVFPPMVPLNMTEEELAGPNDCVIPEPPAPPGLVSVSDLFPPRKPKPRAGTPS